MLQTYRALLKGDRLEWTDAAPGDVDTTDGVEVYVTIVGNGIGSDASDGKSMAPALQNLAASGALSEISDPLAWQREQREDRSLPGRDG
jgi:hypothetical protein